MSGNRRGVLWNYLKEAQDKGIDVGMYEKPFVSWTESELNEKVVQAYGFDPTAAPPAPESTQAAPDASAPGPAGQGQYQGIPQPTVSDSEAEARREYLLAHPEDWNSFTPEALARLLNIPFSDVGERQAGMTFNSHGRNDPLRVDSEGRVWYMDEVMKPAIPGPRTRRRVRYEETGTEVRERHDSEGRLIETFEVAGQQRRSGEILITLPSHQTGIYRDPRLPFRVHTYGERKGYDRLDVVAFYGGLDNVPTTITTLYVNDALCYNIRTTNDTMERELRDLQLGKRVYQ